MARLYAQLCTLLFAVLGIVRRDPTYLGLAVLFAYVGFVAGRHTGRLLVYAAGAGLLLLAIAGLLRLHPPAALMVLDLVTGALAILSGLGTVEDPEPSSLR